MGAVTYANEVKTKLLGVPAELFDTVGAVSPEVARAMAEGVRQAACAGLGVGITGIAGPGGGSAEKPVGLVYVALSDGKAVWVRRMNPDRAYSQPDRAAGPCGERGAGYGAPPLGGPDTAGPRPLCWYEEECDG